MYIGGIGFSLPRHRGWCYNYSHASSSSSFQAPQVLLVLGSSPFTSLMHHAAASPRPTPGELTRQQYCQAGTPELSVLISLLPLSPSLSFNRIDLPQYQSYQQLHSKLTCAIEQTIGFYVE